MTTIKKLKKLQMDYRTLNKECGVIGLMENHIQLRIADFRKLIVKYDLEYDRIPHENERGENSIILQVEIDGLKIISLL